MLLLLFYTMSNKDSSRESWVHSVRVQPVMTRKATWQKYKAVATLSLVRKQRKRGTGARSCPPFSVE